MSTWTGRLGASGGLGRLRKLTLAPLALLRRDTKHQTSRVKNRLRSEASITDLDFETRKASTACEDVRATAPPVQTHQAF